jgi:hypothetical protein
MLEGNVLRETTDFSIEVNGDWLRSPYAASSCKYSTNENTAPSMP